MVSPQQRVYAVCLQTAAALYEPTYPNTKLADKKVYTSLPGKDAPYPFIVIGEIFKLIDPVKVGSLGSVSIRIHAYGEAEKDRIQVMQILETIKNKLYTVTRTADYYLGIQNERTQLLWDHSTGENLIHGVLELDFYYARREQ